jgi:hypothetical protein
VIARASAANPVTIWVGKADHLIRRYRHQNGDVETHENVFVNEDLKKEEFTPAVDGGM